MSYDIIGTENRRIKMVIDLTKLKELRTKAGLTKIELANIIGCRELQITRWETGKAKKPLPPYRKELEKFYMEWLLK